MLELGYIDDTPPKWVKWGFILIGAIVVILILWLGDWELFTVGAERQAEGLQP